MSILPVANQVNEDILVEFLSIAHRNFHASVQYIRLISVHMEDRGLYHLRNFGTVVAGPSVFRVSGKSHLVVHNNVDDTSASVVFQIVHLNALVDDSLTSNSCISVNQNTSHFFSITVSQFLGESTGLTVD